MIEKVNIICTLFVSLIHLNKFKEMVYSIFSLYHCEQNHILEKCQFKKELI